MPAQPWKQGVEQSRSVRFLLQLAPEFGGRRQAIAQQGEVARASASRREPGQSTRKIGHRLQPAAYSLAPDRVFVQPADEAEAQVDRGLVGQRRADVFVEETPPARRLAAVDLAEQAAGDSARNRAGELETVARGSVDPH